MIKDEEAQDRKDAAKARRRKADRIRGTGSNMMIVGGCALVIVMVVSALEPIPPWLRSCGLVVAALAWLGGTDFYVGGQAMQIAMGQAAADRVEDGARHEEVMAEMREQTQLLRDIRRNQTFLLARPGAEGAAVNHHYTIAPGPDTLDMMLRRGRRIRNEISADEQPDENSPGRDVVDPKYLADMSEAVELGKEIERRKQQPPDLN